MKLVRTFNSDQKKLINQAIKDGQMDYVLKAVNAIQKTLGRSTSPSLIS